MGRGAGIQRSPDIRGKLVINAADHPLGCPTEAKPFVTGAAGDDRSRRGRNVYRFFGDRLPASVRFGFIDGERELTG